VCVCVCVISYIYTTHTHRERERERERARERERERARESEREREREREIHIDIYKHRRVKRGRHFCCCGRSRGSTRANKRLKLNSGIEDSRGLCCQISEILLLARSRYSGYMRAFKSISPDKLRGVSGSALTLSNGGERDGKMPPL
jgi:hypothetical protein